MARHEEELVRVVKDVDAEGGEASYIIANVLTAGAHMPSPRFGAYTTSKAALSQFGDTLMAESITRIIASGDATHLRATAEVTARRRSPCPTP